MLRLFHLRRLPRLPLGLAAALVAAGCSADVARFDNPTFNLTESKAATPLPAEPMRRAEAADAAPSNGGAYFPPPSNKSPSVRVAGLPEALPPPQPFTNVAPRAQQVAVASAPKAVAQMPMAAVTTTGGDSIVVQPGDTLFALAKRHNVSVGELMSVNDLKTPAIKPGQKLTLPNGKTAAKRPLTRTEPAKLAAAPAAAAAPATPIAAAPSNWDGTYTVRSGDSPYAIARQHKVSLEELSRVNGISDPRKVMPGAVLKVPSGHAPATTTTVAAAPPAPVKSAAPVAAVAGAATEAPRVVQTTTKPILINSQPPTQVAALGNGETATDASTAGEKPKAADTAAAPAGKFRWPAKGKVVSSFGPRPDGTHNDGINITVPLGTDVLAAEQGVVAYAGSELKGYGNLVLLRHDNGWVTAYAHNDEILVKRGDKVKRGQALAKAGKTGTVDQPQVHFELRQGSRPVDPTPHMEKL